ncbi:MAG: type 1 periplasmic binding fold superfamily protein [Saprospiraceae bacterium]
MKTIGSYKSILLLILLTSLIQACQQDPLPVNESELITTLTYTLTSPIADSVVLTFEDLDGDGGKNPVLKVTGPLQANTTYSGKLILLNQSVVPMDTISNEIIAEANDHQFFFLASNPLGIIFQYDDADSNGRPIGVKTKLQTSTVGLGKLKIILRHMPDKNALHVVSGDITNASGETDIEVEFDLEVK